MLDTENTVGSARNVKGLGEAEMKCPNKNCGAKMEKKKSFWCAHDECYECPKCGIIYDPTYTPYS